MTPEVIEKYRKVLKSWWEDEEEQVQRTGIDELCDLAIKGLSARPEAAPPIYAGKLSDEEIERLTDLPHGPIEVMPPDYIEVGYLLKNEYGFVSAHVPNLRDLKVGQTTVYQRQPQKEGV